MLIFRNNEKDAADGTSVRPIFLKPVLRSVRLIDYTSLNHSVRRNDDEKGPTM
jgi:hypothetical protein